MANNYRSTQGANARSVNWNDRDENSPPRRGNWLPLDALSDEELYSGTPELHAVAAPRGRATATRPRPEWAQPTTMHPTRPQPLQSREPRSQANPKSVQARALAITAGAMIGLLGLYVAASAAVEWVQVKADDMQYGRPRTMQMDAYVGHGEAEGLPSHFIAMNLNRRVTILEMPGGDTTKASTIVGPYLFGQGEDLTPVQVATQDVNADGQADLLVSVKSEQLIYLNDGSTFKLMTPEERAALQKSLVSTHAAPEKSPAQTGQGAGTVEEAGK